MSPRAVRIRMLADSMARTAQIGSTIAAQMESWKDLDMKSLQNAWERAAFAQHLANVADEWIAWRLGQCDSTNLDLHERRLIAALTGEPYVAAPDEPAAHGD